MSGVLITISPSHLYRYCYITRRGESVINTVLIPLGPFMKTRVQQQLIGNSRIMSRHSAIMTVRRRLVTSNE